MNGGCEFPHDTDSDARRLHPNIHPRPSYRLSSSPSYLLDTMAVDFNKLWKKARTAKDETESIRTLAKILSSKDGRTFILDMELSEAELCIEILDHVSSNPR